MRAWISDLVVGLLVAQPLVARAAAWHTHSWQHSLDRMSLEDGDHGGRPRPARSSIIRLSAGAQGSDLDETLFVMLAAKPMLAVGS